MYTLPDIIKGFEITTVQDTQQMKQSQDFILRVRDVTISFCVHLVL